jgi:uncharacterized protein YndB with AHSA1/START domain
VDEPSEPGRAPNRTTVERPSDREMVVTRTFDAPVRLVFEAWTRPELFMRWWAPKSMGVPLLSCEMDVRVGGKYRLTFGQDPASSMAFFGEYIDVIPGSRLVWTNEEDGGGAVTNVTFEEKGDATLVTLHEVYPAQEAPDAPAAGMEGGMSEPFEQLDELLVSLGASAGRASPRE